MLNPSQDRKLPKKPIFNQEWEICQLLGEGNSSKVYLVRSLRTQEYQALKIIKTAYLKKSYEAIQLIQHEIEVLSLLQHERIVGLKGFGESGIIEKPSKELIQDTIYIQMEYVQGGLFFDLCQLMGAMGEQVGLFFGLQLLDAFEHLHGLQVAHRDIKLENLLLDTDLNLKLIDFGFAVNKLTDNLKSYRGTLSYMAPEIKEGKFYSGKKVDIFAFGVVLFIIVHGIFPFKEARQEEYFYNLISTGQHQLYFDKLMAQGLSSEFKDMIVKMFSYDPAERPTVEQLRSHPWFNKQIDLDLTRIQLIDAVNSKQLAQSSQN